MSWKGYFKNQGRSQEDYGLGRADLGSPGPSPGNPGTGPGGINRGQLEPNSRMANMAEGVPYELVPVYPPFVRLANSDKLVYFPRYRSFTFGGNGLPAATTATQTLTTGLPTYIIAMTGSAYDASGAALPVGRTPLQLFEIQIFRGQGSTDLLTCGGGNQAPGFNVIAENVLGTAALPGFIPCTGLFIDTGTPLNVTVEILVANVRADVTFWCIEEWGAPRN